MKTLEQLGISPAPWTANSLHDLLPYDPDANYVRRYVYASAKYEGEYDNGVTTICHRVIEHAEADARLIAAAPTIYEAAYNLLVKLEALSVDCAEARILRAALAKAGGESEVAIGEADHRFLNLLNKHGIQSA